jgi:hypothetical protein
VLPHHLGSQRVFSYLLFMSTFLQLVQSHNLQPADVIVVGRHNGLAAHYLIYMGSDYRGHWFMANLEQGVSWLNEDYLRSRSHEFYFKRIRRFEGDWRQRQAALRRAESRHGEAYSLARFNCEHFANYVQYGKESSQQVQMVGAGLVGVGLLALAALFGGGRDDDHRRYS